MDGRLVTIRHLVPGDEPGVLALHDELTDASRYLRFFAPGRHTAETFVHRLIADIGQPGQGVLLAELDGRVVGMASYSAVEDAAVADVAFAVADSEQSHGLGTLLCEHLVSLARSRGVRTFTADVLAANAKMLRVFRDLGLPVRTHRHLHCGDLASVAARSSVAVVRCGRRV
jgi:GNAT superfamily N-acetyltransferase